MKQHFNISNRLLQYGFWACLLVVLALSLLPLDETVPTTGWDKSNHLLAYAVLAVLGCRAYPGQLPAVLPGLLLFGGCVELLQSLTPYRLAEWGDFVANGLGILAGAALHVATRKFGAR